MQVEIEKLDAIIFVKVLEQGFQQLQNTSVPLIWDHVDEWDGADFPLPSTLHPLSDPCVLHLPAGRDLWGTW